VSDQKLFRISGAGVQEIEGGPVVLERALQTLFERNLETLLGVRFLASEYVTTHGGRMDTLGIDENGCPVIIEYKRDRNENVINQGLFYLDWLMDHRANFELLVRDKLDRETANTIEWSAPRLICIAGDFTKYDEHAVKQMSRNIELIRYRKFGDDLIMLDLLTAVTAETASSGASSPVNEARIHKYKTAKEYLADADTDLQNLFEDVRTYLLGLGDDVQEKALRFYFAFQRIKNFACVEVKPQLGLVRAFLKIDPDTAPLEPGFIRDVRNVGHYGTGDLEVNISTREQFERAKALFQQSYENS
jgi:predicted transport protein